MKKLLAFFCLFSLLTAFTCENEPLDDNIDASFENTDEDLLGTWSLVEFSVALNSSTNFAGQVIESDVNVQSTTVGYTVNFTENNFNTNGSYSYLAEVTANGVEVPQEPYTLENVTGNGSYSVDGNEMTIDGSFFEFTFEGMDFSEFDGEQTATFQITDNGQTLTFSQNETTTETDQTIGATTTTTQVSTSVWSRQ